jgi:hypothetical protein
MKKIIAIGFLGTALVSASLAQTGTFNFTENNVNSSTNVENFSTSNGFSMYINGLYSSTPLNQNLNSLTLNASAYKLAYADDGGIGTGPFSDGEMRNGAGTPPVSGATILELSDFKGPHGASVSDLSISMTSVDYATHEGFLVYGSTGNAYFGGPTQLTLLDHGFGNTAGIGTFDVNSTLLGKYSTFYVTADNGYYSSVALGNGTKLTSTPEPASMLVFAVAGVPVLLRRKKRA